MNFKAMLNKVIRRTELNVAVAGAMVGSVAAMEKLFPAMEGYSVLTVMFLNGEWRQWINAPATRDSGPWKDFLKWYHGRPQSEAYVMRFKEGCYMFRRLDVRYYEILYGEREKSKAMP